MKIIGPDIDSYVFIELEPVLCFPKLGLINNSIITHAYEKINYKVQDECVRELKRAIYDELYAIDLLGNKY